MRRTLAPIICLLAVGMLSCGDKSLQFSDREVDMSVPGGGERGAAALKLRTEDGEATSFELSGFESAFWAEVSPTSGKTPSDISVRVNTLGLSFLEYVTMVEATAKEFDSAAATIRLDVSMPTPCGMVACDELAVRPPFLLSFDTDQGGLLDGDGDGTGFRFTLAGDEDSFRQGYAPSKIDADLAEGRLNIETTSGIAYVGHNDLHNALGVGLELADDVIAISTTILDVPVGTGSFEQAGLWFGIDQDNYHKVIVLSDEDGLRIEHLQELGGERTNMERRHAEEARGKSVTLTMWINPNDLTVGGEYSIAGGPIMALPTYPAPQKLILPHPDRTQLPIGHLSFVGVFASHRNGPSAMKYSFDEFRVSTR